MNTNSRICQFIKDNSNWQEALEDMNIKVKVEGDRAIFNYGINADFSNPIVQEARGIIIDYKSLRVVCWPFRKFGNYHESYADSIDWKSAKVQEKVDGSIIKMYWSSSLGLVDQGLWLFATNSCFDANEVLTPSGRKFMEIISESSEYKRIKELVNGKLLDKNKTYIFELVSPDNQVVIRYDRSRLYHIGTRDNITGEECEVDLGIVKPKYYSIHTMQDCLEFAGSMNDSESYPTSEGFVVVDKDYHRIKVKSPKYVMFHHMVSNNKVTAESVWDMIHSDDFDENSFLDKVSDYVSKRFKYYKRELEKATYDIIMLIEEVKNMIADNRSRKEIAIQIKSNKFSTYGFKYIDMKEDFVTYNDFIQNVVGVKPMLRSIKEYSDGGEVIEGV